MISAGEGFVLRHTSGRYFQSDSYFPGFAAGTPRDHWPRIALIYRLVDSPFAADLVRSREHCGRFLQGEEWSTVADQFEVVAGPGCGVCGTRHGTMWGYEGQWRCDKHRDRNPCAVEGCRRTRKAPASGILSSDDHLCGEHWRALCPPGSTLRRIYNRLWRLQKRRKKWTPDLERRYWITWRRIVRNARSGSAGDIDMNEINKMFGWE